MRHSRGKTITDFEIISGSSFPHSARRVQSPSAGVSWHGHAQCMGIIKNRGFSALGHVLVILILCLALRAMIEKDRTHHRFYSRTGCKIDVHGKDCPKAELSAASGVTWERLPDSGTECGIRRWLQ